MSFQKFSVSSKRPQNSPPKAKYSVKRSEFTLHTDSYNQKAKERHETMRLAARFQSGVADLFSFYENQANAPDPTKTESDHVLALQKQRLSLQKQLALRHDRSRELIKNASDAIYNDLNSKITDHALKNDAEIRQVLRETEPGKRYGILIDAVRAGDITLLSAVRGSHEIAHGISPEQIRALTRLAAEKHAPKELAALDDCDEASELVTRVFDSALQTSEALLDKDQLARVAALAVEADQAALGMAKALADEGETV